MKATLIPDRRPEFILQPSSFSLSPVFAHGYPLSGRQRRHTLLIAVVNSKGGVGKSTIAVHAAAWLHERGLRTGLIDVDEQHSSGEWLARAVPELPIYDLHTSDALIERLPRLLREHDVLVADGPAVLDAATIALVTAANLVLVPVGPSMLDVTASYRIARAVYKARFRQGRRDDLQAVTIFNRVQPRTRIAKVAAAAIVKFGFPVATTTLHLRTAYAEACGEGTVVWRMGAAAAEAAKEMQTLFESLLGPRVSVTQQRSD